MTDQTSIRPRFSRGQDRAADLKVRPNFARGMSRGDVTEGSQVGGFAIGQERELHHPERHYRGRFSRGQELHAA